MAAIVQECHLRARELFDTVTDAAILAWIAQGQEEHLHLDFKSVQREDLSHRDDKRNLARALSGFANSDGGVILWGVDARPNAQGIDCACGLKAITDPVRLVARLNDLTGEFVSPLVDGVLHSAIQMPSGGGCVASLIPASDAGPHMAKAGENRYYKRSGSSFYCMEHFDLEDMFGRGRRPHLTLAYRFAANGGTASGGTTRHDARLVLRLSNTGRGVARSPYVAFMLPASFSVDPTAPSSLPRLEPAMPGVHQYGATPQFVVHPGVTLDVAAIRYHIINERGTIVLPTALAITYQLAAEDMRMEEGRLELSPEDLLHGRFPDGTVPSNP